MAQIVKELRVDVSQPNVFQAIVAKQLDCNSRFLKITLVDFGVKIEVPETAKVTINANRPDGKSQSFMGVANNDGTITVPLAQWMLEVAGELKCDVSVINTTDNKRLTSTDFYVNVQEAANKSTDISENPDGEIRVITPTQKIDENSSDDEYPSAKAVYDLDNITASASGSAITIESANAPLQQLKLFGSTTQDGTPTPTEPKELKSVGDSGSFNVSVYGSNNLLPYPYRDGTKTTSNVTFTVNSDGSITINGTANGHAGYYFATSEFESNLINGKTYFWSLGVDAPQFYLHCKNLQTDKDEYLRNSVVWDNSKYKLYSVYIQVNSGNTVNNLTVYPMLNMGDALLPYEKPNSQIMSMPYTLRSVGNIKDEVDFARGVLIQNIGELELNGNELWKTYGSNRFACFDFTSTKNMATVKSYKDRPCFLCSALPVKSAEETNSNNTGISQEENVGISVYVLDDFSTLDEWKAYLVENPMTLFYELETPIETQLTESELNAYRQLHTNKPNTTIVSEADMEVDYYINKPNAQAIGSLHEQINKDYFKLQQAIITTGGSTL